MFTFSRFVVFCLVLLWPLWSIAFDTAVSTEFSMDQRSSYCLGCHDRVSATPLHRRHPTDIDYLFAQVKSNGKLNPPALLPPAVYLKDGQIVCISCHHPESTHDTKLVISNIRSRLCLTCHNL